MPKPIPIEEAFAILRREAGLSERIEVELAEALGHALAADAEADRDFPPFDQVRMDGFAVRSADIVGTPCELDVIETVPAGQMPQKEVGAGQAVRIMTGAVVPRGADAVVPVEIAEASGASARVRILQRVSAEGNIARRGGDVKQGTALLRAGDPIGPAEVGVLAAVGIAQVPVRRKPRLAVMGTGDEVVEPAAQPLAHQIRNSNSYQLLAHAARFGLPAEYMGLAPDDPQATRRMIERGLAADVFVSTGGVSMGDRDHVGAAFRELGVEVLFEKIHVKPGKPTVFGRKGHTLIFGLPGNPVAALVCFHLFVMTALRVRMGFADPMPRSLRLPLRGKALPAGDRPTYRPVRLVTEGNATYAAPLRWHGSGDLAGCAGADGFVLQAPGRALEDGEAVEFFPI